MYARHRIEFDRLYAWEATPHSDAEILAPLPRWMRNRTSVYRHGPPSSWRLGERERLSYLNFGVSPLAGAPDNPWELVRREATTEDHVVVKLRASHSARTRRCVCAL